MKGADLTCWSCCSEARKAKANGSTRFCMGAAWRDLSGRKRGFERILEMVKGVRCVLFHFLKLRTPS